jgi:hypothetical protein
MRRRRSGVAYGIAWALLIYAGILVAGLLLWQAVSLLLDLHAALTGTL